MKRIILLSSLIFSGLTQADVVTLKSLNDFEALTGKQLTSGTIYYNESFTLFPDWKKDRTSEAQTMTPWPDYVEPNVRFVEDGEQKQRVEKLKVYMARTKTVIDRPASQIKAGALLDMNNIAQLDKQIKHKPIGPNELMMNVVGKGPVHNFDWCNAEKPYVVRPQQEIDLSHLAGHAFCQTQGRSICFESCLNFPETLARGIKLFPGKQKDLAVASQSELKFALSEAEFGSPVAALTKVGTPVSGVIQQNMIYFNQIFQFAKILAVLQPHPDDPNKAVLTTFVALGVRVHTLEKYKLLNAISLSAALSYGLPSYKEGMYAGIPTYTQSMTNTIVSILSK